MATMVSEANVMRPAMQSEAPPVPKDMLMAITALAAAVFTDQTASFKSDRGRLVAFTGATNGEGVSTVSMLVAHQLARNPACRVFLSTPAELEQIDSADTANVESVLRQNPSTGVWGVDGSPFRASHLARWSNELAYRKHLLTTLRQSFDYLLLDCQAIDSAPDITQTAMLVDGVLLVVSAGRSTRGQILHAQQMIENVGGRLEGFCLNRKSSSVPRFVDRLLGGVA